MKTALRLAAFSLLFLTGAQAREPEGSYVYLGAQSGGTSAVMVFVNNTTIRHQKDGIAAATLWVPNPGFAWAADGPAYLLKNDIYRCGAGKISHRRVRVFSRYDHLVSDRMENPGDAPVDSRTLAGLVYRKICAGRDHVQGAENPLWRVRTAAAIVLLQSAPQTGKYAYPRPPQPVTIGTYPFGIAPVENVPVPPGGAWRIPGRGQHLRITQTWRAPDGHIVLEYYSRAGGGRSDYFDAATGRGLFPGQAAAMAHSPGGVLGEKLRPPGLRKLSEEMLRFVRPAGKDVTMEDEAGKLCPVPYYNFMQIAVDGAPDVKVALLRKRDAPKRWKTECGEAATQHYESEWPDFLAADQGGFFAQSDAAAGLIRFDWRGHSAFFSGQDDLIAVPYQELSGILRARLADETDVPDRAAFRRAEALIARYGALQMKGASPLSR